MCGVALTLNTPATDRLPTRWLDGSYGFTLLILHVCDGQHCLTLPQCVSTMVLGSLAVPSHRTSMHFLGLLLFSSGYCEINFHGELFRCWS